MRQTGGSTMTRRPVLTCLAAAIVLTSSSTLPIAGQVAPVPDANLPHDALPEFVEIPAGPFVMGADPARDPRVFENERWSSSQAEGSVDLPAFYIARHEVTVGQFAAFARATTWILDPRALAGPLNHPVTFVSWPNALAYCRWLEKALADSQRAPPWLSQLVRAGWRVRLPSEAEWEKAARGTDRRAYPWGEEPRRDRANYGGTGTTPVGQFACPECPFGLFDMSGNVWEWTSSPYQPYPYDAADDRANLDADALWVMRGGHYGDTAREVRTTTRGAADPGARRGFIGFRVVVSRGPRGAR